MILKQTYPNRILFLKRIRSQGHLKKIIEENEARLGLLIETVNKKKETCKVEGAILSRKNFQ